MKIGINASFLRKPGTGIGQVTYNVLRTLVSPSQGAAIHEFFLYCEEQPKLDFVLPKNFHIRVFLPWWKRDDLIRKMLWEKQVVKEALQDGCAVFLSLYQSSTVMPKNIRHTMFVHDLVPRLFPQYRSNMRQTIHWKRIEKGIRAADHIIAISNNTQNDLVRELNIAREKILVVYLDANPQFHETVSRERMADVLKKYDLAAGYIYHGGGLEIRKNTETLLRAYAALRAKNQKAGIMNQANAAIPPLVISGKIFDETNKLATDVEGLIRELRLQDSVRLLGFVPDADLPALYAGALFFVYPSLYEGFGLPVLEALRMRVPVLSSNSSSLPEVGGTAALYTDPKNVSEMTRQMEHLFSDASLRQTLVSQSSPQATRFSWAQCVQKTLAILME
ncbi:MAG: glycosyltransferase family 1 protein [Candidatus Moraniibacteriota bacterium]